MEKNKKSYFLFIIDKNTNSFSAANITFPHYEKENTYFNGDCVKE